MRFSVVFMFCVSFLKERTCSLHLTAPESRSAPNETHPAGLMPAGSGARSNGVPEGANQKEPCEADWVKAPPSGTRLRGATRGINQGGMNTTENRSRRM